jgi:hypothetical protein
LPPANLTLWVYEKESNSLIFDEYSLSTVIAGLIKEETPELLPYPRGAPGTQC